MAATQISAAVAATITQTSKAMISAGAASGSTSAVTPRIPRMLKMLEPTMLPSATSPRPRAAAATDAVSSGSDVPTATIVRPIRLSETCQTCASAIAAVTSQSAPITTSARPASVSGRPLHRPLRSGAGSFAASARRRSEA